MDAAAFITKVTVEGSMGSYDFEISIDEPTGHLIATCKLDNGGPVTSGRDWNELAAMLPDAVATWEDM